MNEPAVGETTMQQRPPSIAICVCTMDRPDVLRRCLASIAAGRREPDEVLVSDDSQNGEESKAVCEMFSRVRYIRGPRAGLCANRNVVIREATADYIALLDDDALVSQTFVLRAREIINELARNTIVTGTVIEDDRTIVAGNASFWGHFTDKPTDNYTNVNLNCNVFPRHAFIHAAFDENIGYGYEDMDLCSRLLSLGFDIEHDSMLFNRHVPPPLGAQDQEKKMAQAERARFYTSVKRYLLWEKDLAKFIAFVILAPLHRASHAIKVRNCSDLPYCFSDMSFALRTTFRERARLRELLSADLPSLSR